MPRLGTSRSGEDRLGSASVIIRMAEAYASTVQTTSARTNTVNRTGESFIPGTFDDEIGRLGDARLGSHRVGGGEYEGIGTTATRKTTLPRTAESFLETLEADAGITVAAETYSDTIKTVSIGIVPFWRLDGVQLRELVDETRDWQSLSLVFRSSKDMVANRLKPLQATAEKLEIVSASDGTFKTLDRAPTDGVYTLTPPTNRDPPREQRDYLVDQYQQRSLEQTLDGHEVELNLIAETDREPDGDSTDETRASNEWAFEFRSATIATKRVRYDPVEGTNTAADTVTLTLILDAEQTKVLEESASKLGAVNTREVHDGPNTVDDDAPADENTVTVTTPDGQDPIDDGEWVVMSWSSSWLTGRGYRVQLTLGQP